MNILFFLTPKSEVAHIHDDDSVRQALEKMEYHRYSAVPILTSQGKYVGTLTEGDLLWYIKNQLDLNLRDSRKIPIMDVPRRSDNTPVYANSKMEDLLDKAMKQNFVPVLDDSNIFIGIVTRKDIMKYVAGDVKKKAVTEK